MGQTPLPLGKKKSQGFTFEKTPELRGATKLTVEFLPKDVLFSKKDTITFEKLPLHVHHEWENII